MSGRGNSNNSGEFPYKERVERVIEGIKGRNLDERTAFPGHMTWHTVDVVSSVKALYATKKEGESVVVNENYVNWLEDNLDKDEFQEVSEDIEYLKNNSIGGWEVLRNGKDNLYLTQSGMDTDGENSGLPVVYNENDTPYENPGKTQTRQGGDKDMTNYGGPDFWADVKSGMEELDDDLSDLADYVENGDFNNAVDLMETAANQVGDYGEARETAESIAEYLGAVQDDVSDVYDDLEAHRQTLEQAAQDLQDVGWRQDELDSMQGIRDYVSKR